MIERVKKLALMAANIRWAWYPPLLVDLKLIAFRMAIERVATLDMIPQTNEIT